MKRYFMRCWKSVVACVLIAVGTTSYGMQNSSVKKILKNTALVCGCYVLYTEASYYYALYNYKTAVEERNELTQKLCTNTIIPSPTLKECLENRKKLCALYALVKDKKNQTLLSKYFD